MNNTVNNNHCCCTTAAHAENDLASRMNYLLKDYTNKHGKNAVLEEAKTAARTAKHLKSGLPCPDYFGSNLGLGHGGIHKDGYLVDTGGRCAIALEAYTAADIAPKDTLPSAYISLENAYTKLLCSVSLVDFEHLLHIHHIFIERDYFIMPSNYMTEAFFEQKTILRLTGHLVPMLYRDANSPDSLMFEDRVYVKSDASLNNGKQYVRSIFSVPEGCFISELRYISKKAFDEFKLCLSQYKDTEAKQGGNNAAATAAVA